MGDTATKTKKKPPAHEAILRQIEEDSKHITPSRTPDPADLDDLADHIYSDNRSESDKYYSTRINALMSVLTDMHIPAPALETMKQQLRALGVSSYYLDKLSE